MSDRNKYKFIAAVTLMFLLPFAILSRHFIRNVAELGRKDALSYMEMKSRAAASIISEVLAIHYNTALIASDGRFSSSGIEGRMSFLEKKIKENPSIYSQFSILDSSGRELARTGVKKLGNAADYSSSELFRKSVSGPDSAGVVEYAEFLPPALVIIEPVVSGGKRTGQYLLCRMSLAYVGELVRRLGRNSAGGFGLVDAGGQIIADSLGSPIARPGIKLSPQIRILSAKAGARGIPSVSGRIKAKGGKMLVSAARVEGTEWWVYETVQADSLGPTALIKWAKMVIFIGVLLIVSFAFISYRLAFRWLVPEA